MVKKSHGKKLLGYCPYLDTAAYTCTHTRSLLTPICSGILGRVAFVGAAPRGVCAYVFYYLVVSGRDFLSRDGLIC
jgi:hypothetical protein